MRIIKLKDISLRLFNSLLFLVLYSNCAFSQLDYSIVDTGQQSFYNNRTIINEPAPDEPFYGQDAHYQGNQPTYVDNGDGTISDLITGLMWQKTPDLNDKMTLQEALRVGETFDLAGYNDWRLPSIKELYSLINFQGSSPLLIPYIDTLYFDFVYGNESEGERLIDAQYWSSTEYVALTMGGNPTAFGVNFADGRIKGYGYQPAQPGGPEKENFVRYVRGNLAYGNNNFVDNGDGTITDQATGLMWMQDDSQNTFNWQQALEYAENFEFGGFTDWRLPNAKELQSIVDYSRSPSHPNPDYQSAAIDPIFNITETESYFWTSTTLQETPANIGIGTQAAYVAFGRALGYWNEEWQDVHGAGAQRGDPKNGNPEDYPYGNGPQGDDIRIFNYVRLVRAGDIDKVEESHKNNNPREFLLAQNYPNPFNKSTNISFSVPVNSLVKIEIYNILGEKIAVLLDEEVKAGNHIINWSANNYPTGIYYYSIEDYENREVKKMLYLK